MALSLSAEFIAHLRSYVGTEQLLTDPADCWPYGYDNSRRQAAPDVVAFPSNHDQVCKCVKLCYDFGVPLVARGRGTGTAGAAVPVDGGLVLSFERMHRILTMDPDNRAMVVEPGITNSQVQEAAAQHGFFWPPDPTSSEFSTLGGNLACNSAGPRAVKYGTPRENVLGLRVVTGTGQETHTGVYTTKGVVGYDLTRLIIGSEGTLAVITEATLRLTPLAEDRRTLQAVYRDMGAAAAAVSRIMAQPHTPCALEFMDRAAIAIVKDDTGLALPKGAGALLMIEIDGSTVGIDHAVKAIGAAAKTDGLLELRAAGDDDEVQRLWQARKALSPALRKIAPKKINEDIVVPVSRMGKLVDGLSKLSKRYRIPIVNFGHAGNGNIHVNLLVDPDDLDQMDRAEPCLAQVFDLVLELDGTLSGEHGIGLVKKDYVDRELDAVSIDLMQRIKAQFDPRGILNPDKLFPS